MTGIALAAAGGALAFPRVLASALLPRVLGLYIAACAGTIQLLDILVERLGMDERIFTFAIVFAVIGIPFAAAGALLADTARGEKRRPGPGRAIERTPTPERAVERSHERRDVDAERLHRRLDVALSWHRILVLADESGNVEEVAAHRRRAEAEIDALVADLRALLSDDVLRLQLKPVQPTSRQTEARRDAAT